MMKILFKYFLVFCLFVSASQAIAQSAYIESISPKQGYSGQLISIRGLGLTGTDKVLFGSVEGQIVSVTDQLVEAKVPSGATYDNISLFNSGTRLYYSGEQFMLSYGGSQGIVSSDFDTQKDFAAKEGLYDVAISDLDGDGKNDIVGANSDSPIASIYKNNSSPGTISMSEASLNLGAPGLNVTAGDLNGDGKPEIVFSVKDGNQLIILKNNSTAGNLAFSLPPSLSLPGSLPKRVVIKDLDLDGKPDLTVSDQANNKILIVKNTSSGGSLSFASPIELTVNNVQDGVSGLDVVDLNGDGKPEIITSQFQTDGGGFYIATNQSSPGSFSFEDFIQYNTAGTLINLKVGDVNKDNKPDIVATLYLSSAVAVFENETTGVGTTPQFGSAQNLATDSRPWGVDFGDMDGDGNIDMVVSTIGADKTINVLNNDGAGGLSFPKVSVPVTYINRNIKIADIDGDSKPDIVFASVDDANNSVPSSKISILRNNRCVEPVIVPEGPITSCEGNAVQLETQNIEGLTYEWRQDGAVVKTGTDHFIELTTASEAGSYTVTIISEGGNCSEESAAIDVNIVSASSLSSPTISSNSPVCKGGTLTLSSTDVSATDYKWRGPQNFTASGLSVDINDFKSSKAGRYYLDIYSGTCIVETQSIVVEAVPSPNFNIQQSGSGVYCEGETVSLNVTPNDSNFSFQWYKGSSPISGASSETYNPSNSGKYYVEITDQVNTSCPKIYSDTITVEFLQAPQVDFSLPATACIATSVSFSDESVVADESLAQYSWDFGDGNTSTDKNPNHAYSSSGTFDVTLEVSYDGFTSCTSQHTEQIVVNGALNVALSSTASSICDGESAVLSVDGTYDSYQWSTGETTASITVEEGGTYTVNVTDTNGCEGSSDILIDQFPLPTVELSASSLSVSQGDTVTITATGLLNHEWFADSTLLDLTDAEIAIVLSTTTTISVEGVNTNGCFGSAEIVIKVEEKDVGSRITPMKFFSPNGDAVADVWEIENIKNFSECGVEIYDQQGNKIYESKPYNNDWDGIADSGNPVPDGVYYYVVKCDNTGIEKSGSITILR